MDRNTETQLLCQPRRDEKQMGVLYGGLTMRKPRLTDEVVEWAYDKWLDGYSVLAIAKAIGCTDMTLTARFDRAGYMREKPPLRVPQGMKVREGA